MVSEGEETIREHIFNMHGIVYEQTSEEVYPRGKCMKRTEVQCTGNGCIDIDEFLHVLKQQMASPKEEDELKEVFNVRDAVNAIEDRQQVFDRDNDGLISVNDLVEVMQALGERITDEDAMGMILHGDIDRDGYIDYDGRILDENSQRNAFIEFVIVIRRQE